METPNASDAIKKNFDYEKLLGEILRSMGVRFSYITLTDHDRHAGENEYRYTVTLIDKTIAYGRLNRINGMDLKEKRSVFVETVDCISGNLELSLVVVDDAKEVEA